MLGDTQTSGFLKAKPQERSKVFLHFDRIFTLVCHMARKAKKLIEMPIILERFLLFIEQTLSLFLFLLFVLQAIANKLDCYCFIAIL